MSQLPPASPTPPGADPAASVVEPGLETAVHAFWVKHRTLILLGCAAALLAIVIREGVGYYTASREKAVQKEYAQLTTVQLAAFAAAHADHPLAGIAYLRLADESYAAADYRTAMGHYQKAAGGLKNEALLGRARLGAAMSQLNTGDAAAGAASLKAIGSDETLPKSLRAEAVYHLASLAAEAGKMDEVGKLVEEIGRIDVAGAWSQRATVLLASSPAGTPSAAGADASGITFKTGQ